MEEQLDQQYYSDVPTRVRDLEEKTRLLKDRVVLFGQNLIESKESLEGAVQGMKTELERVKMELEKVKEKIQLVLEELESFSRKEDVSLLRKQFKMFEPLEFARIQDVERIVEEKIEGEMQEMHKKKNQSLLENKRGYIA